MLGERGEKMWKVVLLEKAEEEPEACVLDLFVLPF